LVAGCHPDNVAAQNVDDIRSLMAL
jgi:hypothetical protein